MQANSKITPELIKLAHANVTWDLGNQVLYDLCKKHPEHTRPDEILAKIWLIGRAYSASIERRRNKGEGLVGDAFYESVVAPALMKEGIDQWIYEASNSEKAGNPQTIRAHKRLTN